MSVTALQNYTFTSKYAQYIKEKKRRETWGEAIERVRDMHIRRYPQIKDEIEWAFEQSRQKRVLGSQRALQYGGKPIEKRNAKIYNCIASYCDRLRFFQECFWLLLCGCGTGFSVQKHHFAKLPPFSPQWQDKTAKHVKKVYQIPDTIEGWADASGVLMSSYFGGGDFPEYEGCEIIFDYGLIRPEGAPLSTSSGKAPGPEPLRKALEKVRSLLNNCLENGQTHLRPINAYDIIMHFSDAVLSGGVRRSATICIFSPDDIEMATAKTGNWFVDNPQRGRSNNSALLVRGETTKEEFENLMKYVREYGEPGFIWADSPELVVNPCVTKESLISTKDGLRTVESLLNNKFVACVDGQFFETTEKGFWKTGKKAVTRLEFESGRVLRCTDNHQIMTTSGWKEAKEITSEDSVVIHNHRLLNRPIDINSSDYAKGYCLGNLIGDGNISKSTAEMKWWGTKKHEQRQEALMLLEQAGWSSSHHKDNKENQSAYSCLSSKKLFDFAQSLGCLDDEKQLTEKSVEGSWSYLSGLIAGYFDADGMVAVNHVKGCSLRITSTNQNNLRIMQTILNSFGIFSKIYKDRYPEGYRELPNGKGGKEEYFCKSTHELCISCDNIVRFSECIFLKNEDKAEKIQQIVSGHKRTPNRTQFVDKVVNKVSDGTEDVYDCTVPSISAFDANGVYVHNCVEIGLYPVDVETGETGWEACNLCEINGKKCKTEEDFAIACRAAAIIGTCQAGYSDLSYLGPISKKIIEREALLGVSITGMMDNPDILLNPEIQRKMAKYVLEVNEEIARKIGINPTARSNCIKPAGTTSCVLGTASGIHPHHAMRYIRRSQGNYLEPPLQHFKKTNPIAVEKSVWSANGTDEIVAFCIEVPKGAKTKNDIDAIQLLEYVKMTQQNWVMAGTRPERCTQPWLTHNVSNTITVHDHEWQAVTDYIYDNRQYFCGISLLSISGDKDYPQAPFTAIYTPVEIAKMYGDGSLMASGLIVDGLDAFDNNLWKACDAVLYGTGLEEPEDPEEMTDYIEEPSIVADIYFKQMAKRDWVKKMDWVRRAKQFAERYFENDIKKMTYCLKDVSNWKYFCDLRREYKDVDYTEMIEEEDNTKQSSEWACSGGQCDQQFA